MAKQNGYQRYEWWNEMREAPSHTHQLVPLTERQDELIHTNKLAFLVDLIEGHMPQSAQMQHAV